MIDFKNCFGCGVCAGACAKGAISMAMDADGFLKPKVNVDLCNDCGMCLRACSFVDKEETQPTIEPEAYAMWSRDAETVRRSSSGGVAMELAKAYIKDGYTVWHVKYDADKGIPVYYLADAETIVEGSGSKYLQAAAPTEIDFKAKNLIIGTPCMIASLRKLARLRHADENCLFVDFFCHGVPSMLMWQKYLKEVDSVTGKVTTASWRSKTHGWHDSWIMRVSGDKGVSEKRFSQGDLFYRFYLRNRCLRPSCYDACRFKMLSSSADLRIGDLWGRKYASNEAGVSGVVVLTKQGQQAVSRLKATCEVVSENVAVVTEAQMKMPARRPASYGYVAEALRMPEVSLSEIDRKASRMERWRDGVPSTIKYYAKRTLTLVKLDKLKQK